MIAASQTVPLHGQDSKACEVRVGWFEQQTLSADYFGNRCLVRADLSQHSLMAGMISRQFRQKDPVPTGG
jgi:hypothetical protein